jgi:putative tributyrin esterase
MALFDVALFSKALRRRVPMTAIVPVEEVDIPGFPKFDKTRPFRAVFLLHGMTECNTEWLRGTRIELYAALHNVAVFLPSGENSFYLDDPARDALYEQYLCNELIEFTRAVFPVSKERRDTTIGGLSMGGYGALRNGLKHSDVYGNIIAFSSALITDRVAAGLEQKDNPIASANYFAHVFGKPELIRGSDIDPKALARERLASGKPVPNVYMACGSEDILLDVNRDFHEYLAGIGFEHVYEESPGIHDHVFWDAAIQKALTWLDGLTGGMRPDV